MQMQRSGCGQLFVLLHKRVNRASLAALLSSEATYKQVLPNDFSSYSKLKNYTISRIKAIGLSESLVRDQPNDYAFFRALFQGHPRAEAKKTAQITDIRIRVFPLFISKRHIAVKNCQMYIITADGDEDTISWVKSMRHNYSEKNSQSVMIETVSDQIHEVNASKALFFCTVCGMHLSNIKGLDELCHDFTMLYPNYPIKYNKKAIRMDVSLPEDAEYESLWKAYYLANASLDTNCRKCNPLKKLSESDITLTCKDCKTPFVFSVHSQKGFARMGFAPPIRCTRCQQERKVKSRVGDL